MSNLNDNKPSARLRQCCKSLWIIALFLCCALPAAVASTVTINTSTMETGGKYGGKISSPFSGVALYANGDYASTTAAFPDGSGVYTINITGASSNSTAAGVSLYVGGSKVAAFSFTGTTASTQTAEAKLYFTTSEAEVKLLLETDNGSNDTYINKVEFVLQRQIVDRPAPTVPTEGAFSSGIYRNLFAEAGYTDAEIQARLQSLWQMYFEGDTDTERVYYETGDDEAYILDVNNDDIRSEGMSYGMMICVQMNKQAEFNKLWKWVKNHMQLTSGAAKGFIGWQIKADGTGLSTQCAPDGDEYMIMALMFAAGRWGNGEGIYDYWQEANDMLNNSISKDFLVNSSTTNMFNDTERQVVFVPYASSAKHTDPSYHMPAFYELWAKWANYNRPFWASLAAKSREMYPLFANATTGLMPDYATFAGAATGSGHQEFRYDAWRCAMHMGTDYAWFAASADEQTLIDRLLTFFEGEGITSYGSEYKLNGTKITKDHSPGLVACNGVGALASTKKCTWDVVDDMFSASLTTGRYRYYDGMLYFLGFLHASGNFRIYRPADVLDVALNEQFRYSDDGEYLIVDDYEQIPDGYQYFIRRTEGSTGAVAVETDALDATNHALRVQPGNYDEYYYLKFTLPEGTTLTDDFTQLEFDIYYNPDGNNANQTLKVCIDNISSAIYTENTGAKSTHGVWKHVTVPLSGSYGNAFKFYLLVRPRDADYSIDNLKLKLKTPLSGITLPVLPNIDAALPCYNLSGQRVDAAYKGLVIQNGRKVLRK